MQIYLVRCIMPEYDRTVCIYTSRRLASNHKHLANHWIRTHYKASYKQPFNPLDPGKIEPYGYNSHYELVKSKSTRKIPGPPYADSQSLAIMKYMTDHPEDWPIFADWIDENNGWGSSDRWRNGTP